MSAEREAAHHGIKMPISWTRFLTMWASLALVMSANGIFREAVLKRVVSSRVADILSAALGIGLIALVARVGFAQMGAPSNRALAFTSAMLVILTVTFETLLGIHVDHKSIGELVEHYAVWNGELWPIVLAFLAWTPFLWARRT